MTMNPQALISKLNETCKSALLGASQYAKRNTHYEVDLEHLLFRLCQSSDADVPHVCRYFAIDPDGIVKDLIGVLDRVPRGNSRSEYPYQSPRLLELLSEAWNVASVEYNETQVRSAHLLLALLSTDNLSRYILKSSPRLGNISVETLRSELFTICKGSSEDLSGFRGAAAGKAAARQSGQQPQPVTNGQPSAQQGGKASALDQFTVDLTAQARGGRIDPVLGRDHEVRQIIDILTRRRQNNPILTGEAGVGKTAVVEGFALRIAGGDVPPSLKNVELRTLDLALLQAGAGMKGEFENRLKSVIAEVKASPVPIILFIDEAHTMIGAGGSAGTGDAANLLKPALARGELRTIAATTWSEYKKYFEKDAALARRFQVVKIDEPGEDQACVMLRGMKATLEKHHKVIILDEGITAAVRLSRRYISGRHLPDKAVSVLDTACARISLAQNATPGALEDAHREIASLDTEIRILERESASGSVHEERLRILTESRERNVARAAELTESLERERTLVSKIIELRGKIEEMAFARKEVHATVPAPVTVPPESNGALAESSPSAGSDLSSDGPLGELASKREELARLNTELATQQGEQPMVRPYVDEEAVAEVIASWTGIPVGKMLKDEIQTVLRLEKILAQRIIGQDHALEAISQRIHIARAGLDDPRRPIGVFLLVGPSGVGKTETALALADTLYGGQQNLVVINMSEYQEPHSISGLKGSPPGYVGYGEGGVLTEAVRRKPYCVILLDEMEKAHIDVMELFYQVFDKGFMEDAEGREVDFKNTVILMTSNAASAQLMALCSASEERPDPELVVETISPELRRIFKPALLGRLVTVPYYPIDDASLHRIIRLKLNYIAGRLEASYRAALAYSDDLVEAIAERCTEVESGARNIDHILTGTILPDISTRILSRMVTGESFHTVSITIDPAEGLQYEVV
jgi:type VI secretion system protein VasG